MHKRNVLNDGVRVASALALLVAMMISPLRPLQTSFSSLRPDPARAHWAGMPRRSASIPARLSPTSVRTREVSMKALPSEIEEEDLDSALHAEFCFFTVLSATSAISIGELPTGESVPSLHPLRC